MNFRKETSVQNESYGEANRTLGGFLQKVNKHLVSEKQKEAELLLLRRDAGDAEVGD